VAGLEGRLGASRAVWTDVAAGLEERGFSVLVPDLLGFGGSRTSGTRFSLADHVLPEAIECPRLPPPSCWETETPRRWRRTS